MIKVFTVKSGPDPEDLEDLLNNIEKDFQIINVFFVDYAPDNLRLYQVICRV